MFRPIICYPRPKLFVCYSDVSWAISKRIQINHPHHIKAENVVRIGRTRSEIIGQIYRFLPIFFHTSTKMSKWNCRVTKLDLTKFVHDVATFNAFLTCQSPFWYSNPFWNGSVTMKVVLPKTPIFRLKLVAMATSLEWSPNKCKIYQALTHRPTQLDQP